MLLRLQRLQKPVWFANNEVWVVVRGDASINLQPTSTCTRALGNQPLSRNSPSSMSCPNHLKPGQTHQRASEGTTNQYNIILAETTTSVRSHISFSASSGLMNSVEPAAKVSSSSLLPTYFLSVVPTIVLSTTECQRCLNRDEYPLRRVDQMQRTITKAIVV